MYGFTSFSKIFEDKPLKMCHWYVFFGQVFLLMKLSQGLCGGIEVYCIQKCYGIQTHLEPSNIATSAGELLYTVKATTQTTWTMGIWG